MKTAGTSFRQMLLIEFGEKAVFPNDTELSAMPNGFYPKTDFILEHLQALRKHKILVGHHPLALHEKLGKSYQPITFLRDPFERSLSALGHWKRHQPGFIGLSFEKILDNQDFVQSFILNYQTKALSMGVGLVNSFHNVTAVDLQRAIDNLKHFTFIGISEHFQESSRLFDRIFKTKLSAKIRHENASPEAKKVSEDLRKRIEPLIELDLALYQEALKQFKQNLATHGIPAASVV